MTRPTPETIAHRIHATPATVAAQSHAPQQPAPPVQPAPAAPLKVTGAGSLVKSLEALGVDVVFGIPGGAILPAYDPLYDSKVRHILVRHEQGAGHAATGYAQATGKVGVCIATSGPGATNLVTPIADAYMDSVAIVAITGQVPRPAIGTRRLPGGRHPGHHAADHQAQLPGADAGGDPADPGRGVPPRLHRPARPGPRRHPQGRPPGADHVQLAAHARPARLPADAAPARQADPRGGAADQHREAPGAVRRRRRAQGRRHGRSAQARRADRHPGRHHADGPRRVPRLAPAAPGHARHARHGRRGVRPAEGRPARRARRPLRRPGDRQARLVRARTRRSCTPTSTRPRSARTGPPTCRSSATPST